MRRRPGSSPTSDENGCSPGGAGYGSGELAHDAETVTGIDRDSGALEFARTYHERALKAARCMRSTCGQAPADATTGIKKASNWKRADARSTWCTSCMNRGNH